MNPNTKLLQSLDSIPEIMESARMSVMESYINFDKKLSTMEKNQLVVGSADPIIEAFIENRSTLVPQYIEETAKGRSKLLISFTAGCITGSTVGAILSSNIVLGALLFSGAGTAFVISFASAFIGTFAGGVLGIKISDAIRRKGIRGEILKDIKDATASILLIKPEDSGSFTLDKRTKKALSGLSESINTFKRMPTKVNPPASREEIDAYSDLSTAIFAILQNATTKNANALLSEMNKAAEICMKQSGINTSEIKSETKSAIKKAMVDEKKADNTKYEGGK